MESLKKFNKRRTQEFVVLRTPHNNGIACPECGHELIDSNPGVLLASDPPKKDIHCPACPFRGYREV